MAEINIPNINPIRNKQDPELVRFAEDVIQAIKQIEIQLQSLEDNKANN